MFELSGELIAAAGAAIAGVGGVGGVVIRAVWEKMREENKRRERLPCETHTALMRGLADDVHDLSVDYKTVAAAIGRIDVHLATMNGRIGKSEEKIQDHIDSIHAHGD